MYAGLVALEGTLRGAILAKDNSLIPTNAASLPTWRVYGPSGYLGVSGTAAFLDTGTITGATNASPIVITDTAHGLTTGARVTITGVLGNTAANGTFIVTRIDADTFSLDGSTGNGAYTSGGTWNVAGAYSIAIAATAANGFAAGENYVCLATFSVSGTQKAELFSFSVV